MAIIDEMQTLRARRQARLDAAALGPLPPLGSTGTDDAPAGDTGAFAMPNVYTNPPLAQRTGRALQALTLAFEPLQRTTSAFRVGILTALGEYDPKEFGTNFGLAWNGKLRIQASEFNRQLLGDALYRELEETNLVPGWTRAMITPEWARVHGNKPQPRLSASSLANFGADILADPFTWASLTPLGAPATLARGARAILPGVAGRMAGAVIESPYKIVTRPLTALFGPESHLPTAYLSLYLEPIDVLTGKARPIFEDTIMSYHATKGAINETALAFQTAIKNAGLDDVLKNRDSRRALGAWISNLDLTGRGAPRGTTRRSFQQTSVKLSRREQLVANIMSRYIYDETDLLMKLPGADIEWLKKNRFTLGEVLPRMTGLAYGKIPFDIMQSFDWEKIGRINFIGKEHLKNLDWTWENLDGLETFKAFIYTSKRKQHLEPTLLKYAPKRHAHSASGTRFNPAANQAARIAAGEDPVTASLSPVQYRYVQSWFNEFTGHGRGRTHLMFDAQAGVFWDRVLQTPIGKRLEGLFRLTGAKENLDGLLDFSPTAKISSALTHNIFRSAIGGSLKSALVNMSQLAVTPVGEGMPHSIMGMLRFHDPSFRNARKTVDLMRDYKAIFDVPGWGQTWRQEADEILFYGFNNAEKFIRGFAFNTGLDRWMRTHNFRDLAEVAAKGRTEEAFKAAHFASIESSFIYGVLGTSPMFMNPALGPARSLVTYGMKQAAHYHRVFSRDGGALLRFIGLHGWLIEQSNQHLGIAGERMFGWGFMPSTRSMAGIPLVESPPVRLLLDTTSALQALKNGDTASAEAHFKKIAGTRDAWFRTISATGITPLPWRAANDIIKVREQIATKQKQIGEGFVPISRMDAAIEYAIGATTSTHQRQVLRDRLEKAKSQIDAELDRRSRNYVRALANPDRDGDRLFEASMLLAAPVWFEGERFWPEQAQYDSRIDRALTAQRVPKDVIALDELGILEPLFLQAQLEQLQRAYR